jgi:hypothetical protein
VIGQTRGVPTIRSLRGAALTQAERDHLVARFRDAWQRREAADDAGDRAAVDAATAEITGIVDEYRQGVPIVSLSRCPFTGEVFETSLDIGGIDGPWWAYEYEFRPYVEPPPTFFAWTGAMQLDGPIPDWSLKTMVGPSVPFVLPRILDHPDVRAVVSSVLIGEHVGYAIVYFAQPIPRDLDRVDDWGHRGHLAERPDGSPVYVHAVNSDDENDYDLGPWIERGKLAWIEPGDLTLTLRTEAAGCPYVDLPGERRRRYVQEGITWLAV